MKLLSTEYVRKEAVKGNIAHEFLYIIATPLSKAFVKLNVSPNVITTASIISAILAFISLIIDDGYIYFCIFWFISFHLDFCDGTVARMTGKLNKTGFRFDHMSDIFKISLVIIGAGIHYNTMTIWILSATAIFLYLYSTIFNHDLEFYSYVKRNSEQAKSPPNNLYSGEKESIRSRAKKSAIILNIVTFFGGLSGHTLVFFLIIPFGLIVTKIFLIYFSLLTLSRCVVVIKRLLRLPKLKRVN